MPHRTHPCHPPSGDHGLGLPGVSPSWAWNARQPTGSSVHVGQVCGLWALGRWRGFFSYITSRSSVLGSVYMGWEGSQRRCISLCLERSKPPCQHAGSQMGERQPSSLAFGMQTCTWKPWFHVPFLPLRASGCKEWTRGPRNMLFTPLSPAFWRGI